jgi:hypothetical protein
MYSKLESLSIRCLSKAKTPHSYKRTGCMLTYIDTHTHMHAQTYPTSPLLSKILPASPPPALPPFWLKGSHFLLGAEEKPAPRWEVMGRACEDGDCVVGYCFPLWLRLAVGKVLLSLLKRSHGTPADAPFLYY